MKQLSDKTAKRPRSKTIKRMSDKPRRGANNARKNVFLDLGHDDEKAAGQILKSYFFMSLQEIISKSDMTQGEVAELIGADQPIVSKIVQGRTDLFAIERVVNYIQKLGYNIHVNFEPCPTDVQVGSVILGTDR
jgi:predicted XRE-type DNA-binding protein